MEHIDSDHIPGTELTYVSENEDIVEQTKKVLLVPQATISPNDPLTWSKTRKYIHLFLVLLFTGLTAATSNSCSAESDGIQTDYPDISDNVLNVGNGLLFLGIGWWTLLTAPSVYLYGSRIGYLVGVALSIAGNAWYANVRSATDVILAEMLIGASESVTEAVAQLSITQVFFQHEAQHFIGLYVMAISVGTFVGPIIGSIVAEDINWRWVGYVAAICSGFTGILLLFGLEETYFDRNHFKTIFQEDSSSSVLDGYELSSTNSRDRGKKGEHRILDQHEDKDSTTKCKPIYSARPLTPSLTSETALKVIASNRPDIVDEEKREVPDTPKTYWQRIALITPAANLKGFGFKQYLKRLLLYLKVLAFPPVIYSGLQWGAQDAWLSFYVDLEDDYYYDSPWNYSNIGVGIMDIPCLIGAVIGCVYGVWFSDWFCKWRARRNGGVKEAEFRLWCLIPAGIISPVGMFLLGIGTEHEWKWYATYVGLGFIGFGWGCYGDLSMSYLVDCYPEMVLEGMVGVSLINNNMAMIFSFVVDRWIAAIGPQNTMVSVGLLNFFFVLLTFPMIYFGKRCRRWTKGMYYRFVEARDGLDA